MAKPVTTQANDFVDTDDTVRMNLKNHCHYTTVQYTHNLRGRNSNTADVLLNYTQ